MSNVSLKQIQNLMTNFEFAAFNEVQDFLRQECLCENDAKHDDKRIVIINGGVAAGKSTVAYNFFKQIIGNELFYLSNDSVYYKMFNHISPFDEGYDMARDFTNRKLDEIAQAGKSFVWETVLSKEHKRRFIERCLTLGYKFTNVYVYVDDVEKTYERSKMRVEQGSHSVALSFIQDRFDKSRKSLEWLVPISETNIVINNTEKQPKLEWYKSPTEQLRSKDCPRWVTELYNK